MPPQSPQAQFTAEDLGAAEVTADEEHNLSTGFGHMDPDMLQHIPVDISVQKLLPQQMLTGLGWRVIAAQHHVKGMHYGQAATRRPLLLYWLGPVWRSLPVLSPAVILASQPAMSQG